MFIADSLLGRILCDVGILSEEVLSGKDYDRSRLYQNRRSSSSRQLDDADDEDKDDNAVSPSSKR